ncbi:RNA-directed DNA polymerase, eukaryota, reverse transcriptase zinc-binding domain protein [Tanacetum coccineum]
MGYFNEVRKKDKRFGSVFNVHGANAFNLFISIAGLEEVPLGGCSYTWYHKSASKMSKLDRFLISGSLMNSCPNISVITLKRFLSDYRPILMRESHYDYGPVSFWFFHYWFEIKGFDKVVEDSWKEAVVVEPNAMTKLMKKLKHLKEKFRLWNKENMMSSINRKRTLKSDLADLDLIIDKGCGDVEIVNKRANVVKSLQELENLQSLEAAQKSKIKWAIEGDENSKYYHRILNKKRSQLAIRGILVDGNWIDSPHLVKQEFLSHFKNYFDHPQDSRLQLDLNFPNTLQPDQIIDMECDVSKYEIKRAFPKGSNSSFITLIPKTRDANMVNDFRPISLIGSMYKIIAKILANRLVLVLGDLVNEVQSAFIADRQILDVDFEKAFDSVRWDYLDDILRRFGFGEKWCSWIQSCLRSSRGSVIVNGGPMEEFQFHKGLKQDDPLSPLLFILVNGMSHAFRRASGLRLNMSKSKLMGIYVDADKVAQAARKIGCVTLKTPFTYLESWHGDVAFKFLFPRAYALESCKNIDVASKLSQNSLTFTFRREPRVGVEQDQFDSLKAMVEGDFTVASIRKLIDTFTLSEVSSSTHWIKAVPIKVNVLAWKIKLDNLPTRLNISRRGMDIDYILCPTCGKAVESTRMVGLDLESSAFDQTHSLYALQNAKEIVALELVETYPGIGSTGMGDPAYIPASAKPTDFFRIGIKMDEVSKRKKKKRGKSLIFKKCFRLPSSRNRGKVLASDDNLIYCDANGNCEPEIKKSTSSRGRVSRVFKAVLFDTAMKKKMGRKKSSKPLYESENTSPVREDETEIIENLFIENDTNITKEGTFDSENASPVRDEKPETIKNSLDENKSLATGSSSNGGSNAIPTSSEDNDLNDAKKLETGSSSNDSSNIIPKLSKENDSSDESQVASSSTSSINVDSQILTERKVTARVNSMKKKPPLPSKSKPSAKTNPASGSECGTLDNATYHWCLIVLLAVFILVVYWMS